MEGGTEYVAGRARSMTHACVVIFCILIVPEQVLDHYTWLDVSCAYDSELVVYRLYVQLQISAERCLPWCVKLYVTS